MKPWQTGLTALAIATAMLVAGACTKGGNVDDNDGAVSDTSLTESASGGALSELMSDVESTLGLDESSADSGTATASSR